jgi:hypothetical protein
MRAAITPIPKTALSPNRHAGQVIAAGGARLGPQRLHHRLPFGAVGSDVTQSIEAIGDIMGDLVRHRNGEIVCEVLGENIRVVANDPLTSVYPVHTGGSTAQIESHRNRLQLALKYLSGLPETIQSRTTHLLLPLGIERLNDYRHFTTLRSDQSQRAYLLSW